MSDEPIKIDEPVSPEVKESLQNLETVKSTTTTQTTETNGVGSVSKDSRIFGVSIVAWVSAVTHTNCLLLPSFWCGYL
jgi:hypothetical protein